MADLETDFTTVASMDEDCGCSIDSGAPSKDPRKINSAINNCNIESCTATAAADVTATTTTSMEHATDCTEVVLEANGDTNIVTVAADEHNATTSTSTNRQAAGIVVCWAQRLEREEVFSSRYRLSVAEEQELQDLEVELGLRTKPGRSRFWGRGNNRINRLTEAQKVAWQRIARPSSADNPQPQQQSQQPSFILKRGTCWLQPNPVAIEEEAEDINSAAAMSEQRECHVVLLTRGLAVAFTSDIPTTSTATDSPYTYQFHNGWTWNEVEFVQPTQRGFAITLEKYCSNTESSNPREQQQPRRRRQFTFSCANLQEQQDWMNAFYSILVQYHTHNIAPSRSSNQYTLGWQYQYVYRPGFTLAVTNRVTPDLEALDRSNAAQLNVIDDYHGYAPLHYAVKCHHVPAIVSLLEHRPDIHVDVLDAEGHTPLYLAVQDELPPSTRQLLLDHGARPVTDAGPRGELFGKVAATEQILEERQREKRQEQQAKAAQAEIANNMKLLQRRGEQINELNDKASDLNQGAADFASMAKQLKAAAQKKKWYQL